MTSIASSADAGEERPLCCAGVGGRDRLLQDHAANAVGVVGQVVRAAGVEPAQRLRTEGF